MTVRTIPCSRNSRRYRISYTGNGASMVRGRVHWIGESDSIAWSAIGRYGIKARKSNGLQGGKSTNS